MSTIDTILELMRRVNLSYNDLAAGAGISPTTARALVLSGALPDRQNPRDRLEKFASVNREAMRRGQVRFIE